MNFTVHSHVLNLLFLSLLYNRFILVSQEDVDSSMQLWLETELLRAKKLRGGSEKAEKKEDAEEEAVNLFVAMSLTRKEAYTFFAVGFMKADR